MSDETPKRIAIIEYDNGHDTHVEVKSVDVTGKSASQIDRVESGMNINLNHDRFYTELIEG